MGTNIDLELPSRVYADIELFCKTNGLDIKTYIVDLILEAHTLKKYGDINEKIEKIQDKGVATKRKTSRKKKEDVTTDDENDTPTEETEIKTNEEIVHKVVRRKRNIAAK